MRSAVVAVLRASSDGTYDDVQADMVFTQLDEVDEDLGDQMRNLSLNLDSETPMDLEEAIQLAHNMMDEHDVPRDEDEEEEAQPVNTLATIEVEVRNETEEARGEPEQEQPEEAGTEQEAEMPEEAVAAPKAAKKVTKKKAVKKKVTKKKTTKKKVTKKKAVKKKASAARPSKKKAVKKATAKRGRPALKYPALVVIGTEDDTYQVKVKDRTEMNRLRAMAIHRKLKIQRITETVSYTKFLEIERAK